MTFHSQLELYEKLRNLENKSEMLQIKKVPTPYEWEPWKILTQLHNIGTVQMQHMHDGEAAFLTAIAALYVHMSTTSFKKCTKVI